MQNEHRSHPLAREAGAERFQPAMVANLPEPARRYLLHAIQPGTPLATSVDLRMKGRLRLSPERPWMSMKGAEVITDGEGFVWKASVGQVLRICGFDRYRDGKGEMCWRLWGAVPVLRADGADVTRSAIGRFAAELVLLPSALLPQRGVIWSVAGPDAPIATVTIEGATVVLHLRVSRDGGLEKITVERWGNQGTEDGRWRMIPFAVTCAGECGFGGYWIPA